MAYTSSSTATGVYVTRFAGGGGHGHPAAGIDGAVVAAGHHQAFGALVVGCWVVEVWYVENEKGFLIVFFCNIIVNS